MAKTRAFEAAGELCDAMGLDPNHVRSISLSFEGGCIPTATVVMFVGPPVVEILKRFRWTEMVEGELNDD